MDNSAQCWGTYNGIPKWDKKEWKDIKPPADLLPPIVSDDYSAPVVFIHSAQS